MKSLKRRPHPVLSESHIRLLEAASSDPSRMALATLEIVLDSYPLQLKRVLLAAAVPHWFDESILAQILDEDLRPDIADWWKLLATLPFVETFPRSDSLDIHDSIRLALRSELIKSHPSRFTELSARAALAFTQDKPNVRHERLYHLIISEPEKAAKEIRDLELTYYGDRERALALTRTFDEYADGQEYPALARGWAFLLRSWNRAPYQNQEANSTSAIALFSTVNDEWGTSLALRALGDSLFVKERQMTRADELFRRAHVISGQLLARDPDNPLLQWDNWVSHAKLGEVAMMLGNFKRSHSHLSQAMTIASGLSVSESMDASLQRSKALLLLKLGDLDNVNGQYELAEQQYKQSVDLFSLLAEREPLNPGRQRDLAISVGSLGVIFGKLNRFEEAEEKLERCLQIFEQLATDDHENADWPSEVASTCCRLIKLCEDHEKHSKASKWHIIVKSTIENMVQQGLELRPDVVKELSAIQKRQVASD